MPEPRYDHAAGVSPVVITQPGPGVWRAACHHPACPPFGEPHTVRTGRRDLVEQAACAHLKKVNREAHHA